MTEHNPLLTHMTAVDPYFRLLNNLRRRQDVIHWQATAQRGHTPQSEKALSELKRYEQLLLTIEPSRTDNITYRHINKWFRSLGSTEQHCTDLLGAHLKPRKDRPVDEIERKLFETMKNANTLTRIRDLKNRILLEIIHRHAQGWYIIFNTLTVSDDHYERIFHENNRDFEKYINRFAYSVWKGLKDGTRSTPIQNYHSYFAVVERGNEKGRLHFHVLHFCRALPPNSIDPNGGRSLPRFRIIDACRGHWQAGFTSPIAVRLNGLDNYGRLGWRWPVEFDEANRKWVAIEASNPLRLANYIAKYITKGAEDRTYKWRTRISQKLGNGMIQEALQLMSDQSVNAMMMAKTYHLTINNIWIPRDQMRKEATRESLRRLKSAPPNSKQSTKLKSLTKLKPQPSIVAQFRTLTQTKPKSNSLNTGYIETKNSNATAIFEARQTLDCVLRSYEYNDNEAVSRGFIPKW